MLRFSIRDLLWVAALAAVGVGWWLELKNRGPENVRLRAENVRLAKERNAAYWRLGASVRALKDRGITLTPSENSVQLHGDFKGKYVSGIAKKSPASPASYDYRYREEFSN